MNINAILFIKISIERKKYLFGLCVKKSNFLITTVLFWKLYNFYFLPCIKALEYAIF